MSGLPAGWLLATIEGVTSPIESIDPSNTPKRQFRYVDIGSIDNTTQSIREAKAFLGYDAPSRARRVIRTSDTLFSTVRTYLKNVALVPPSLDGELTSTGIAVLRPNEAVDPRYLYRWACSNSFIEPLSEAQDGTMYPAVSDRDVAAAPIPLPPLPEQRRIVAKIDSLTAKSRRARDHLDHIPRLVEKYKQAVLAAAFRGDLTREWRMLTHPTSSAPDSREVRRKRDAVRVQHGLRSKGKNRSIPPKIENLLHLPEGWHWVTFDDCSWDMTVGHVGSMRDRYRSDGIPFLRSLNVKENAIDLSKIVYVDSTFNKQLAKSQLRPGDLVIVRTGSPGVAAVIPKTMMIANCSDLVICRLIDLINPHFAAFYMNSPHAKSIVMNLQVGMAQQHFNVGAMAEMPLPLAPTAEQAEICCRIERAFAWIDRLAAEATSARALVDRLDQAVLAKAFRGELVPQDPADEPASVLLERIRAERVAAPKPKRGRRPKAAG